VQALTSHWLSILPPLATAAALAVVLGSLIKNKLRSEFPVFFTYVVFGIIMPLIAVPIYLQTCRGPYFFVYWTLSILFMGLEFGILYEIFLNLLKPHPAIIDLGKMLFRWAAVFLVVVASLTAFATNGTNLDKLMGMANLLNRSMLLMETGLLMLFFFFEKRLGLSWKSRTMSIAVGLGISATSSLIVSYLQSQFPSYSNGLNTVDSLAYFGVVVFWAYCLSRKETSRVSVQDSPSRLIFQRWDEALATVNVSPASLLPNNFNSFIPGVEQAVDRVLSRKLVN
jgi:hypothetical protein